jgi:hypothetical protein
MTEVSTVERGLSLFSACFMVLIWASQEAPHCDMALVHDDDLALLLDFKGLGDEIVGR